MHQQQAKVSNPISEFFRGFRYPFRAFTYLGEHKLWPLAKYPIILNVFILIGVVAGATMLLWPFLTDLTASITASLGGWSWFAWLGQALGQFISFILWVLLFPASLALGFLTLVLIGQAVASPFLDTLSQKVEINEISTPETPLTAGSVARSVAIALADLFWGILVLAVTHIPLFIIGLIPGLGTTVAGLGSFFVTNWLLAHEFVGLPLSRREVGYWARWRMVWQYRWRTLGLGAAAAILLWIPGINIVLLPLATVGGTLLFCELSESTARSEALSPFSS